MYTQFWYEPTKTPKAYTIEVNLNSDHHEISDLVETIHFV